MLGIVALIGCATESAVPQEPGARTATTTTTPTDAAPPSDAGAAREAEAGPLLCPPDLDGFEPLVGPPATPRRAACTDAEIDALARGCLESADRFEDAACTGPSTPCAQCMLSKERDATWGPVVMLGDASMHGFVVNQAGCIETLTGVAGCGDAIVAYADCLSFACAGGSCPNAEGRAACQAAAEKAPACARLAPSAACITAYEGKARACVASGKTGFVTAMRAFCQAP